MRRPVFSTLGLVFIVELIWLTIWGYLTPGRDIHIVPSAIGLAVPALATIGAVWLIWWKRNPTRPPRATLSAPVQRSDRSLTQVLRTPFKVPAMTAAFVVLLLVGSIAFASFVNTLGAPLSQAGMLLASLATLLTSFALMSIMIRRLVRISQRAKGL